MPQSGRRAGGSLRPMADRSYGFHYFFGFIGGDTSQWTPNICSATPRPLSRTLVTLAGTSPRRWRTKRSTTSGSLNALQPEPAVLRLLRPRRYACPPPSHAGVDQEVQGDAFDMGWNALRDEIFANQKKLGVIPQNAQLTAWPEALPMWDTLAAEEKKLYSVRAEVYAAYLAYTDYEIGRVVQAMRTWASSTTRSSSTSAATTARVRKAPLNGTPNEFASLNGMTIPSRSSMKFYDAWGTDQTYPHFAVAWAWAFDTPFQWTKQVASHFGGTRKGMAMSWPARIKDVGGIRNQFSSRHRHRADHPRSVRHRAAADGQRHPAEADRGRQHGLHVGQGERRTRPTRHTTQYFEMFGSRAIYQDGWMASAPPVVAPWALSLNPPPTDVMNGFPWQLYDLHKDWTQANDLAAQMPDKLRDLKQAFTMEARNIRYFRSTTAPFPGSSA